MEQAKSLLNYNLRDKSPSRFCKQKYPRLHYAVMTAGRQIFYLSGYVWGWANAYSSIQFVLYIMRAYATPDHITNECEIKGEFIKVIPLILKFIT